MKKLSVIMCLTALTMSLAACGSKPAKTNLTKSAQIKTSQSESVEMTTEETSETIESETSPEESSEEQTDIETKTDADAEMPVTEEQTDAETNAETPVATEQQSEAPAEPVSEPAEQSAKSVPAESAGNVTLYTTSYADSVGYASVKVNVYDRPSTDGIIIGTVEANEPIYCTHKVFDNGWYIVDTSDCDIPNGTYEYGFVDPSVVSNPKAEAMTTHFPESGFWTLSVTVNPDGTATVEEIW